MAENSLFKSIAILYLEKGWSLDNLVKFIVNGIIDEAIVNSLPDSIKNCKFFKLCIDEADFRDIIKVLNNEETDVNSIECLSKILGLCIG